MALLEVLALDTTTPQIRAPGAADLYSVPRSMFMSDTFGYYGPSINYGMQFQVAGGFLSLFANGPEMVRVCGTPPYGLNVYYRIGFGTVVTSSDVGLERVAAKVLKISDGGVAAGPSGNGCILLPAFTVGTLPVAAAIILGARATVSDASVVAAGNYGTIVATGGANVVPVYCDGTNWRIG